MTTPAWTPTTGEQVLVDGTRPATVINPGPILHLAYCRFPSGQCGNVRWRQLTPAAEAHQQMPYSPPAL